MSIAQTLFSAQGRIRRRDYWLWSIGISLVFGVGIGVFGGATGAFGAMEKGEFPALFGLVYAACVIVLTWISVCLIAKRWHDRDKSGWMYLILFIPLIGGLWTLIECGFLDGTQGPNRYGPSPKGINNQPGVF
ncbi:hypothetical protein ABI_43770 [Asticcacaulis biprosthecium C19]|uniref:Inner membrane protein yhaI n=1 Tax=Asticcacaulis biprosthecium C19 TaxID=715226 RepID=F4QT82_9CAUL|nr:DUF805 domain-containing protein [Asticcacaulis biprosthecium]EGF89952.1 hypothetical protein ABI_43770 [Asticcacaulis biprosthecium C19]